MTRPRAPTIAPAARVRADNSHHIIEASQARRANTLARADAALQRLRETHQPVSVARLATEARVSRSWIYTQPDLLDEIQQSQPAAATNDAGHGQRQGASAASLLRRLELAHERIKQLTDDNRRLRDQLARAHGQRRAERQTGPTRDRSTIGPCS